MEPHTTVHVFSWSSYSFSAMSSLSVLLVSPASSCFPCFFTEVKFPYSRSFLLLSFSATSPLSVPLVFPVSPCSSRSFVFTPRKHTERYCLPASGQDKQFIRAIAWQKTRCVHPSRANPGKLAPFLASILDKCIADYDPPYQNTSGVFWRGVFLGVLEDRFW